MGGMGGTAPAGDTRATEEARVAGCAERISRRTGTGARTEPAPLGCVAPRHAGIADARIRVEALTHNARGVRQAPAAGLDWHVGNRDAGYRAIHDAHVALFARPTRRCARISFSIEAHRAYAFVD